MMRKFMRFAPLFFVRWYALRHCERFQIYNGKKTEAVVCPFGYKYGVLFIVERET